MSECLIHTAYWRFRLPVFQKPCLSYSRQQQQLSIHAQVSARHFLPRIPNWIHFSVFHISVPGSKGRSTIFLPMSETPDNTAPLTCFTNLFQGKGGASMKLADKQENQAQWRCQAPVWSFWCKNLLECRQQKALKFDVWITKWWSNLHLHLHF